MFIRPLYNSLVQNQTPFMIEGAGGVDVSLTLFDLVNLVKRYQSNILKLLDNNISNG